MKSHEFPATLATGFQEGALGYSSAYAHEPREMHTHRDLDLDAGTGGTCQPPHTHTPLDGVRICRLQMISVQIEEFCVFSVPLLRPSVCGYAAAVYSGNGLCGVLM